MKKLIKSIISKVTKSEPPAGARGKVKAPARKTKSRPSVARATGGSKIVRDPITGNRIHRRDEE